jgi:hypothetical protein
VVDLVITGPASNGPQSAQPSVDGDLAHVDGDQQRLRDALVVALPGVASSRGGDDDAVDVAVASGIEQPGGPAEDVDGEVMAAQQPVRAEARDLLAGVTFDVIGERYFQPPPRFTIDLDRGDLFGDEPGPGVLGQPREVFSDRTKVPVGLWDGSTENKTVADSSSSRHRAECSGNTLKRTTVPPRRDWSG